MADRYSEFVAAVRAAVQAAWPEVEGVWEAPEIAGETLDRIENQDQIPYAVVDIDTGPGDDEGALDDCTTAGVLTVYYVARAGKASSLRARLAVLAAYFWEHDLAAGQLLGKPYPNWSMRLPLATYFANNRKPFTTGAVIARFLLTEGDD